MSHPSVWGYTVVWIGLGWVGFKAMMLQNENGSLNYRDAFWLEEKLILIDEMIQLNA